MKLITAKILSIKKHPDAQKLNICTVFDGTKETSVVCGASNVRENMITIFAPVGATTPKGLEIKVSELRGVASHGMLCSPRDLNVHAEDGLVDLPQTTELGLDYLSVKKEFLSSTPWHQYKKIDAHYEDQKTKKITVLSGETNRADLKLISETYFHDGRYLYRHYQF